MAGLNILTLGSGKTYTNMVALGISNMRVSGTTVYFTVAATGEEVSVTLPAPADGISIANVEVNANKELIITLSDNTKVNAGIIPTVKGDKGDKLTFNDLTDEEKASLKGADGFSPSAKVEKVGDTATITITDKDGTTTATIKDGQGGTGGSGEENKIEVIKVNGVEQAISADKSVDITVPSTEGLTKDADLATVAKSGDYEDLINKPTIPEAYDDTALSGRVKTIEDDYVKSADIPSLSGYATETWVNEKGFLTEHQDISGKVDKVDGKSLIADSEIERLASVDNYDDTEVKSQIQAVANGLMDSVGYSADYKTIDIIAKNGVKKSVNVAPIISHASITELSDVDTTNKATGKALVYNSTTSKHEYADVSGTDEKVKMDASTDAKYLGELLDNITIANENGKLKVKKLDGQEVTITEINYLKGLTMNVMDLVNMFSNGGVKIINTPVATYAELLTLDKSSFIEGISYLVYVLADENHDNAKTTYLVDKDSEIPTYFGFADSQRDFTTNPIDLATEITGKLGIANMDSDAIKALFTVDDTYKTETATNNAFSTHGAKALYDELLLAIGNKANSSDLTAHKDDVNIHVSTTEKDSWNGKADASDLTAHTDDADIHVTADDKTLWDTVEDKVGKTDIATALDDTVTDEQVTSALLAKTELDKKIDKTSIATELSDASTDDEVVGALTTYNELQKLESANKEQFGIASGDYITVTDSVDGNVVELGIKGNSFQKTYRGVNLFNPEWCPTNTNNGVTVTNNGDNSWTFSGSVTDNTKNFLLSETVFTKGTSPKQFHKAGYYIISVKGITLESNNQYAYVNLYYNGNPHLNFLNSKNKNSVILTEEMLAYDDFQVTSIGFYMISGNTLKTGTLSVQIEYSETATEFEPYVGCVPAPNPEYPQEINSVGDDGNLVVKSCGKNLIKNSYTSRVVGDLTITVNKDGTINLNGTYKGTSTHFYNLDSGLSFADYLDNRKLRKGKYVLSFEYEGELSSNFYFFIRDDYTAPYTDFARVYKSDTNKSFSLTEDTNTRMYLRIGTNEGFDNVIIKPMLRRCDENGVPYGDNIFEPYHETTTTIPLSEPLRAIGDVKDEITYQNGKWGVLRRFKKYTFDGSDDESWLLGSTNNFNDVSFIAYIDGLEPVTYKDSWICVPSLCDRFSKKDFIYQNTITDECYMVTSTANANRFSIRLLKSRVSEITVDAVKVWLASNPITVWYELKTPVFEPFADQSLPYLSTYDGVTNISNDDALSAEMTVKYPTTDASGVGSQNESRIAELAKDTDDVNKSLSVIGKCKNLLKPTLQTTTINGITCTNNGDGTYTLNGTNSSDTNAEFILYGSSNLVELNKEFRLTGCPNNTYAYLFVGDWGIPWELYGKDTGNGINFKITTSSPDKRVAINVPKGVTVDNIVFKPMITTDLSATYDDFVPYTGDGDTLTHDVAEIKNDLSVKKFELVAGVLWLCVCGKHCVLTLNGYNLTEPTHFDKLEEYQPYLVARNVVSKGDGVCIAAVEPNGNINASDLVVGTSLTGQLFGEISWIANI